MTQHFHKHYTYKYAEKFNEICQPIFRCSPITFCSIGRIFKDGCYTGLMSDPVWTELYLHKHYLPTLSLWVKHKISQAKVGYDLWALSTFHPTNESTRALQHDCHLFNYQSGICLVDDFPNYYEVSTFSSSKKEGIDHFFIQKMDQLRNYILYMKEKIDEDFILKKEIETKYKLHGNAEKVELKLQAENVAISKFYLGFPLMNHHYLTKRELDCLVPYVLGLPKKKVSQYLNISVRTIETHLENIKKKCNGIELTKLRLLFLNNRFISTLMPTILEKYLKKYP